MKPVVHYTGKAVPFMGSALVTPVDHYAADRVSNTMEVRTSAVVRWDEATGEIETRNTIYRPSTSAIATA